MDPALLDHILAAIIVVLLPISGVWEYRYLVGQLAAGVPNARIRAYRLIIGIEWALVIAVTVAWIVAGRTFPELGFGMKWGLGTWIGWGVTAVLIALILVESRSVFRSEEKFDQARQMFETKQSHLLPLIPHTGADWQWFRPLAITAGICEEILHRGFLIAYLSTLTGQWPAVVLSSVAFGFGHAYQGIGGIVKTTMIGCVFAVLYVFTGSLWAPILLHAVIDLNSGYLGYRVVSRSGMWRDQRLEAGVVAERIPDGVDLDGAGVVGAVGLQ
jgi:membrane protease YdiL (CAAX protease family)